MKADPSEGASSDSSTSLPRHPQLSPINLGYAKVSAGWYEAKTDPLDAQVLSHYGVVFSESDTSQLKVDPDREELRHLLGRRRQLVEQRVRDRNRLDKGVSGSVGRSIRRNNRWLDRAIERLDEEYKELLNGSASLSETVELYQTVPGVGQLSAPTLVAHLPELGRWDGRALASLEGLAPWSRDSECLHKYARISAGAAADGVNGTHQPITVLRKKPDRRQRAWWEAIHRAKLRGTSNRAIAKNQGISRITVKKYLVAGSPEMVGAIVTPGIRRSETMANYTNGQNL